MSAPDVAAAERRVGEWLRANPTAFEEYREEYGCPDLVWLEGDSRRFRKAELAEALRPYLEPPGDVAGGELR